MGPNNGGGGYMQPQGYGRPQFNGGYGQSGYGMGGGQNFGAMTNAGGGSWGSGGNMAGQGQPSPGQVPSDQAFRTAFGMGPATVGQPQDQAQGGSMQFSPMGKMVSDPAGGMNAPLPGPPPFTGPPDQGKPPWQPPTWNPPPGVKPPFNPHPLPVWGPKPPFNPPGPGGYPQATTNGMGQMTNPQQDPYSMYRPGGMSY